MFRNVKAFGLKDVTSPSGTGRLQKVHDLPADQSIEIAEGSPSFKIIRRQ